MKIKKKYSQVIFGEEIGNRRALKEKRVEITLTRNE